MALREDSATTEERKCFLFCALSASVPDSRTEEVSECSLGFNRNRTGMFLRGLRFLRQSLLIISPRLQFTLLRSGEAGRAGSPDIQLNGRLCFRGKSALKPQSLAPRQTKVNSGLCLSLTCPGMYKGCQEMNSEDPCQEIRKAWCLVVTFYFFPPFLSPPFLSPPFLSPPFLSPPFLAIIIVAAVDH